jgi:hypothetical protein
MARSNVARQPTGIVDWFGLGVGALAAGILLWSILPGPIARILPEGWHVPKWMAIRTIGTDRRDAVARLLEISQATANELQQAHQRRSVVQGIGKVDPRRSKLFRAPICGPDDR